MTLLLVCIYAVHAIAGDKKKRHAPAAKGWDPYSCCHRLDDTPRHPGILVETFLVPEFYYPDTLYKGDTAFSFAAYDTRDSVLNTDTVPDFARVSFLSLFKSYTDHLHTYRDNNGQQQPLPVSIIVQRYDRLGGNKWSYITYPENKYSELKEYKNEIVRTDTFIDQYGEEHITLESIYRYYKVRGK